jgi:hypothetical protein
MKATLAFLVVATVLTGRSVEAEIVRKSPYSFRVEHKAASKAAPAELYRALGQIGRWWSSSHTLSGRADNLSLEIRAGGCFCEKWPEGDVEHARVIETTKNRLLRLQGALGPLRELPVSTVWTFRLEAKGTGTELKVDYWVSGDMTLPVRKWAAPSDAVLAEQIGRLVRFAETGKPD